MVNQSQYVVTYISIVTGDSNIDKSKPKVFKCDNNI